MTNPLALSLKKAFAMNEASILLQDGFGSLASKSCIDKINEYRLWLAQFDTHSVMVLAKPSIDALCLCYALILSNKTYIPVHPSTAPELINNYVHSYPIDLVIIHSSFINSFKGHFDFKPWNDEPFYFMVPEIEKKYNLVPGIVFFSSGTTGTPKAAHYDYSTLNDYLKWCINEFQLSKTDKWLFTSELSFIASLRPLFLPVMSGAAVSFLDSKVLDKVQHIIDKITSQKISVLNITPSLFRLLIGQNASTKLSSIFSSLGLILLSGETLDVTHINYWFQHIKKETVFYNLYGATEYLVPFYKKIEEKLLAQEQLHLGQLRAGCAYKLIPKEESYYELYIAGSIANGYLNPLLTEKNYLNIENRIYIKTEDLITLQGKELFFSLRMQRRIKHFGQLINLDQIILILKKAYPSINFITLAVESLENKVFLFIQSVQDSLLLKQIKNTFNEHVPAYMHPDEYRFIDHIPLTSSGKIDYINLQQDIINNRNTEQPQTNDFSYLFQPFFPMQKVNCNAKIVDLGMESIDYIELSQSLLKLTGKNLDFSKMSATTRIADLNNCLTKIQCDTSLQEQHEVKLSPRQTAYYKKEIQKNNAKLSHRHIAFLCLKKPIDIGQLEQAIAETIANHFMLSCRLECRNGEYFLVRASLPTHFKIRAPLLFINKLPSELQLTIHSDRLVKIGLQQRKNNLFLVISYHHIVLDGWAVSLLREEIFRRYEGIPVEKVAQGEEIKCLNQVRDINYKNNILSETKKILCVNYLEFNQFKNLFNSTMEARHTTFEVSKEQIDSFIKRFKIENASYNIVGALLLYLTLKEITQKNKILFLLTLSNRHLPILNIHKLITCMAQVLPLFIDAQHKTIPEVVEYLQECFTHYFKHMSYSDSVELWNELFNESISMHDKPIQIIYTYINKITTEFTQNKYINWSESINELCFRKKIIFFRVYNFESKFVIILNTKIKKGYHDQMIKALYDFLHVAS